MWPNPQETVDLITFTNEISNGKLHFLRSEKEEALLNWFSWSYLLFKRQFEKRADSKLSQRSMMEVLQK